MIIQTITWEDSNIEIEVLKEILLQNDNPEILMLATSCDTILTLLNEKRVINVTCVSSLSRNLAVLELKLILLNKIENYQDRINFFDGVLPTEESIKIYDSIKSELTCKNFWDENIDMVVNGIHMYDKWLKLFYQLKKNNYDFKKTFSYKKMIEVLGKPVVDNGLTIPYWKYFENIYEKHKINKDTNPYYYNMNNFQYPDNNLPNYLTNKLSNDLLNKIKLINQDLVKYLYNTNRKYAMISLGAFAIDRYNNEELHTLFELLQLRTLKNGRIIVRIFNNDNLVRDIINRYFVILDINRDMIDKTYLYKDIIIARPRNH